MKRLDVIVKAWNAAHPVGTLVEYRSYPGAVPQRSRTRTAAEVLSGHTPVVWLEGKAGCVYLASLRPTPAAEERKGR